MQKLRSKHVSKWLKLECDVLNDAVVPIDQGQNLNHILFPKTRVKLLFSLPRFSPVSGDELSTSRDPQSLSGIVYLAIPP